MDHCKVKFKYSEEILKKFVAFSEYTLSICTTNIAKPQNVIKENGPCIVPWEYT